MTRKKKQYKVKLNLCIEFEEVQRTSGLGTATINRMAPANGRIYYEIRITIGMCISGVLSQTIDKYDKQIKQTTCTCTCTNI